jgi:hypothetical protein
LTSVSSLTQVGAAGLTETLVSAGHTTIIVRSA